MATIGSMNKRVRFENPTKVPTDTGGMTSTYSLWFTTWGHVSKASAARVFSQGFDALTTVYDFYVLYRSDIATNLKKDTRIVYDGRRFGIVSYELLEEEKTMYHFKATEAS